VRVEDKRQGPPKLPDLPSLQKLCGSRFGWPASKTLEVAQELYDGQGKKIITYPRAEVRYLPQSLMSDVPKIVAVRLDGAFRLLLLGHGPTVPFRQRCCETSDPVLLTVLRIRRTGSVSERSRCLCVSQHDPVPCRHFGACCWPARHPLPAVS